MYLVDMDGNVVHTWKHTDPPGLHAVLLPDGSLLRPMRLGSKAKARVGGPSGGFQIYRLERQGATRVHPQRA